MIKTVLFDFVNTVARHEPTREEVLQQFIKDRCKKNTEKHKIIKAFNEVDELNPYSSVQISNEAKKQSFYEAYNKILFHKLGLMWYNEFYKYYKSVKKKWVLYEESLKTIEALKAKNIKVGIISNFDKHLDIIAKELQIYDLMDIFVVSAQVGLEKPDVGFYNYVKDAYNLDTTTTAYIGDSYSLDYAPSRQAGYAGYLIDRHGLYSHVSDRITNLFEIIRVVDNAS
tara:strand:+ start:39 stop:719 length:681 start_codon:yes stop_codon:yes gene_type:complete